MQALCRGYLARKRVGHLLQKAATSAKRSQGRNALSSMSDVHFESSNISFIAFSSMHLRQISTTTPSFFVGTNPSMKTLWLPQL